MKQSAASRQPNLVIAATLLACCAARSLLDARNRTAHAPSSLPYRTPRRPTKVAINAATLAAANRFSARVDVTLSGSAASKGEWGLLIADAATGETLYALNDDKYFVPASNMKLFTTALALSKLGLDYKFHTTLETRGTISDRRHALRRPRSRRPRRPESFEPQISLQSEGRIRRPAGKSSRRTRRRTGRQGREGNQRRCRRRRQLLSARALSRRLGNRRHGLGVRRRDFRDRGRRQHRHLTLTPGLLAGDPVQAEIAPVTPDFYVAERRRHVGRRSEIRSHADARAGRATRRRPRHAAGKQRAAQAGSRRSRAGATCRRRPAANCSPIAA